MDTSLTGWRHGWRLSLAALALMALGGCATHYTDFPAFMKKPKPVVGGKPYVIDPPDSISVIAPNTEELKIVNQQLRPDGKITLPLLGEVFAAGKTPTQLANELQDQLREFYEDAPVQVQVTSFNSKVYYMAGETTVGPKQYTGSDTVLDAVLRAGIPRTSWPEHLIVLRPNEEGQLIQRMTIDATDLYEKGDLKYNAVLEEGDIIFMPTNPIARVGIFIQNLLSPVQPVLQAGNTPSAFRNIGAMP